jgi:hypothetical protein
VTIPEGEMRGLLESHLTELQQENLFTVEKSPLRRFEWVQT